MSWTKSKGMQQIGRYCAYQERSHAEVRTKLQQLKCPPEEAEEVMVTLIEQGFLNEERFARAYARGKFNQKAWGKHKIRQGLRGKGIGESLVDLALAEEIPEDLYQETLSREIRRHWGEDTVPDYEEKQKIRQHFIRRGFEWELVDEVIKDLY
jgi:regulatory protein